MDNSRVLKWEEYPEARGEKTGEPYTDHAQNAMSWRSGVLRA
jgi:hypothetical protein